VLLALSINHVCISFEPLGRFNEIWYGGNAIQGDFDAIIFIRIVSAIFKWLLFKFKMKLI
jgi:hypothetical protein